MTTDTFTVPALYIGTPDAQLRVWTNDGDSYTMALISDEGEGHTIAEASGFRPGACQDFGGDAATAGTFGSFLSHALEDAEFARSWEYIGDDAGDWTDALALIELDTDSPKDDPTLPFWARV